MRFDRQDVSAEFAGGILSLQSGGLVRRIDFTEGAPRTLEISLDGKKLAGRGVELEFESAVVPAHQLPPRLAAEYLAKGQPRPVTVLDTVAPIEVPADVRATEFRMRTDYSNEPIAVHAPDAEGKCIGNILEWRSGKTGMVMFQEAPPANERQDGIPYDFELNSGAVKSCGAGFPVRDVMPDRRYVTHRHWFGVADDTARLVRKFYLARIPETLKERYAVTANPV